MARPQHRGNAVRRICLSDCENVGGQRNEVAPPGAGSKVRPAASYDVDLEATHAAIGARWIPDGVFMPEHLATRQPAPQDCRSTGQSGIADGAEIQMAMRRGRGDLNPLHGRCR